jgi:nitrate reductase NapE component
MNPNLNRLEKTAEPLAFAFFILVAMALVLALAGAGGYGFLLLALAGCAHAARVGLEDFAARGRQRAKARPLRSVPARRPARHVAPAQSRRRVKVG